MNTPDPVITGLLLLILAALGIYALRVNNELATRRERLKGLTASAHSMRRRRRGIVRSASRGVRWATRHEQHIARLGSRRAGRGSRRVSDIANRWPAAGAIGNASQAVSYEIQSLDAEAKAWQELQREAEAYNALLREFPRCVVASAMGFRPWRLGRSRRRPRSRRGGGRR